MRVGVGAAIISLLAVSPVRAAVTVGINGSGGADSGSAGFSVGLDLVPSGNWSLNGSYDYSLVTQTASPSLTHAGSLELDHTEGDWSMKAGVDYSNDQVNFVAFAGPSLGLTYEQPAPPADDEGDSSDADPSDDPGVAWRLMVGADIHAYAVDLGVNSRKTKLGTVLTQGALDLTQFYPNLRLEKPLWGGRLTASLSYGHDFYNKDPDAAAAIIARRFTGGSGGARASALTTGLNEDSAALGLAVDLGAGFGVDGSFGGDNVISPAGWSSVSSGELSWSLGSLSLAASWSDTVQAGEANPSYSGNASWRF